MEAIASSVAIGQRESIADFQHLLPGNIIPNEWYKKFIGPDGPDLVCITLLADIVALYRLGHNLYESNNPNFPKFTGDSLSLSYEYFEEKFGFSKERTRRALVRLENLNILKREICNIKSLLNKRINRLFIVLNSVFFNSCFRNAELDIRVETKGRVGGANIIPNNNGTLVINPNSLPNTYNLRSNSCNSAFRSPRSCGDHIRSNKNNYKENRSIAYAKSNFLKNFSSSFLAENDIQPNNLTDYTQSPNFQNNRPTHNLKDFYPLSEQDCSKLQSLSGRDFSLRAMNEILLDMSERLKDRWFKGKKSFLNYMSKAFKYEMRDAVKTDNETFYIKNNLKIQDTSLQEQIAKTLEVKKQEQYLAEVEYSLEVSPEWHLRKKLASVLERSTAYNLLTSYICSKQKDGVFIITLGKHMLLSQMERKIILEQIKATQESGSLASGEFSLIDKLEIIMPEPDRVEEGEHLPKLESSVGQKTDPVGTGGKDNNLIGIWGRVRKSIAEYYGQKGQGIDQAWFSKLEPEIDEEQRTVKLKAPTSFIRDWISREYGQDIERFLMEENYQCLIT